MAVLFGNYSLSAVIGGVTLTCLLRVPLQRREPIHRKRRFVRDSLDYQTRAVTTVGNGVYELAGVVRYADNPSTLLRILIAGADGTVINYFNGIRSIPCMLIEPHGDELRLVKEEDADPDFEFTADIVLRTMDGTDTGTLVSGYPG